MNRVGLKVCAAKLRDETVDEGRRICIVAAGLPESFSLSVVDGQTVEWNLVLGVEEAEVLARALLDKARWARENYK